ncbi:MAG: transketolase [Myxococcales bacterium]|nr:transketolase [Myxococcales bacterium]HIK83705.1 transketolase [Myxococcales bacterium]
MTVEISELEEKARRIRELVIRTVHHAGVGHVGGPLSMADVMAALYFRILRLRPDEPNWEVRDRFILSKGHSTSAWYAALAERGFFPVEHLKQMYRLNSPLQGHPDMKKTAGVDMSSGSLGQGLSAGIGMAIGAAHKGQDFRVFVLQGDGECDEGQVWEAALYGGHHQIRNLVLIIDCNRLQQTGRIESTLNLDPLDEKLRAFRWTVLECNGNQMSDLLPTLERARDLSAEGPVAVVSHTVKGHGVSFAADRVEWHAKTITDDLARQALEELGAADVNW